MAKLEEAWTVNHAVSRSSLGCAKMTKCLQQAFNPIIDGSFGLRPKLGCPLYHKNIVGALRIDTFAHWASAKIPWCCWPERVVQRIPLDYAVPEVMGTENLG